MITKPSWRDFTEEDSDVITDKAMYALVIANITSPTVELTEFLVEEYNNGDIEVTDTFDRNVRTYTLIWGKGCLPEKISWCSGYALYRHREYPVSCLKWMNEFETSYIMKTLKQIQSSYNKKRSEYLRGVAEAEKIAARKNVSDWLAAQGRSDD